MYNDIVSIGPITIHGYGLMISIGIIAAILLAEKRAKAKGLNADMIYGLAIACLIPGFLGAKILFCMVEYKSFINHPWSVLSGEGFVVYGGIIGGVAGAALYCRIKKCNFFEYFDLAAPSVAIAQGFGRIGCFLAGCCYGRETNCIIGITFHNSEFAPNNVKLIPTQLFSSAGDFLIAVILLLYAKNEKIHGRVGALYIIMYSIGRFIIEIFRNDYRGDIGGLLSTSQFIAIITLITGIALYKSCKKFGKGEKAA